MAGSRNIILVVVDSLRADHLGCYGYFRDTSPTLDGLADGGVRFNSCYASGVCTGTAFTSIHTGLYPIHHGVYQPAPQDLVLDEVSTLAELLRSSGYTTIACDNLAHNRAWTRDPVHYYRGFEYYISDISNPNDWNFHGERTRCEWYNQRLLALIKQHSAEPVFAFIHYWDPHQPYTQPAHYRQLFRHREGDLSDLQVVQASAYGYVPGWGRTDIMFEGYGVMAEDLPPGGIPSREASIDLYDGAIAYADYGIGQLVEALSLAGTLAETLVVVTADHGELLGQHDIYTHANLYEGNTRIPLILHLPDQLPANTEMRGLVGQVDLLPTLLDLAGIEQPPQLDGMSLVPLINGGPSRAQIIAEEGAGRRAVMMDNWKYIFSYSNNSGELFDLQHDPMELIDLAKSKPEVMAELELRLQEWVRSNLPQGEEDPICAAVRDSDQESVDRELKMDSYRGIGYTYRDRPDW